MGLGGRIALLDSQTAFWLALDSHRLGPLTRHLLRGAPQLSISVLSIAELEFKQQHGRIEAADIPSLFMGAGLYFEPVQVEDVVSARRFENLIGHDPFDRLIQGQAARLNANLFTSDRKLIAQGFDWIVDSRT